MTGRRSVWFALSIVGVVALPIVLRNYRRYRKTEQALERFIAEHVSEERMRSIKRLQFTSESIQAFYAQQDFGKTQRVKRMFEEKKVVRSRITAGDSVVTNIASGVEMQHIKHGRRRSRYSPESEQLSSISIDEEVKGSWLGRCCLNCQPSDTSGKCYEKCYVKVAAGCSLIK
jgi:hypothetical protein